MRIAWMTPSALVFLPTQQAPRGRRALPLRLWQNSPPTLPKTGLSLTSLIRTPSQMDGRRGMTVFLWNI